MSAISSQWRPVAPRPDALAAILAILVMAAPLPAEATTGDETRGGVAAEETPDVWTPGPVPPGRSNHAMAYDTRRDRLVIFGGQNRGQLQDTWEWDGRSWEQRAPLRSPSARAWSRAAYDERRGRVVLFGGCCDTDGRTLADTWEWDGQAWTRRAPKHVPPRRMGQVMAYHPGLDRVVLFGGRTTQVYAGGPPGQSAKDVLADTWTWDGSDWSPVGAVPAPPPRWAAGMAWDDDAGELVLFGGCCATGADPALIDCPGGAPPQVPDAPVPCDRELRAPFGDTWTFDGFRWVADPADGTTSDPPPRYAHGMATRPGGGVLLFGGTQGSQPAMKDTWTRADGRWTREASTTTRAPHERSELAMAYSPNSDAVLLFGGNLLSGLHRWRNGSWHHLDAPRPTRRSRAAAAVGPDGRPVLFGGLTEPQVPSDETWEWDGSRWWLVPTPHRAPAPRSGHAMALASDREAVVLFGGRGIDGALLDDTWTWDGRTWQSVPASPRPPPREGHALAWDPRSATLLLHGGRDDDGRLGDTWAFDGSHWRLVAATPSAAREGHALVTDGLRRRVLLVGGRTDAGTTGDTSVWEGGAWRPTAATIPARWGHTATFDRVIGRVVVVGGFDAAGRAQADSLELASERWVAAPGPGPSGRGLHAAAYDETDGSLVVSGGASTSQADHEVAPALGDVWLRRGRTWMQALRVPPGRTFAAATTDERRDEVVVFSGEPRGSGAAPREGGDTWRWDGVRWREVTAPGVRVPPRRSAHGMAYDRGRGVVVLFGGRSPSGALLGDTWELDGDMWQEITPAGGPTPREGHAMGYDEQRGRIVAFGGHDGRRALAETWEWDGARWLPVDPAPEAARPDPRSGAVLVHHEGVGRTLLFGGRSRDGAVLGDTWERVGTQWRRRMVDLAPTVRWGAAAAYDAVREQVVVVGGQGEFDILDDTWAWNGTAWLRTPVASPPTARAGSAGAFDPVSGRVMSVGGSPGPDEMWSLQVPGAAPRPSRFPYPGADPEEVAEDAPPPPVEVVVDTLDDGLERGTLRYAIAAAPAGAHIVFARSLHGTVELDGGELVLRRDITIDGDDRVVVSAAGRSRVLRVEAGRVLLRHMQLADGTAVNGGAVAVDAGATLTLDRVVVRDSRSTNMGGGLYSEGALTLRSSRVEGNDVDGGMSVPPGHTTPVPHGRGGGIAAAYTGMLEIVDSTISHNWSRAFGGGVAVLGTVEANVRASTISHNRSNDGAGLYALELRDAFGLGTRVVLDHTTVTANAAASDAGGVDAFAVVELRSSILSGNTAATEGQDFRTLYGYVLHSLGGNVIGYDHSCSEAGRCRVVGMTDLDRRGPPGLGPLTDNGGVTRTHHPLGDSLAIDAVPAAAADELDQRGAGRGWDGDGDGTPRSDAGAVEARPDAGRLFSACAPTSASTRSATWGAKPPSAALADGGGCVIAAARPDVRAPLPSSGALRWTGTFPSGTEALTVELFVVPKGATETATPADFPPTIPVELLLEVDGDVVVQRTVVEAPVDAVATTSARALRVTVVGLTPGASATSAAIEAVLLTDRPLLFAQGATDAPAGLVVNPAMRAAAVLRAS